MSDKTKPPQSLNEWLCALPEGRQAVLREDKWMLADNAFGAGQESCAPTIQALRDSDSFCTECNSVTVTDEDGRCSCGSGRVVAFRHLIAG